MISTPEHRIPHPRYNIGTVFQLGKTFHKVHTRRYDIDEKVWYYNNTIREPDLKLAERITKPIIVAFRGLPRPASESETQGNLRVLRPDGDILFLTPHKPVITTIKENQLYLADNHTEFTASNGAVYEYVCTLEEYIKGLANEYIEYIQYINISKD